MFIKNIYIFHNPVCRLARFGLTLSQTVISGLLYYFKQTDPSRRGLHQITYETQSIFQVRRKCDCYTELQREWEGDSGWRKVVVWWSKGWLVVWPEPAHRWQDGDFSTVESGGGEEGGGGEVAQEKASPSWVNPWRTTNMPILSLISCVH